MGPPIWAWILCKHSYIPERSFHDAICEVHLVPSNLNQVKKIDGFLKDLLKEKNKNNSLTINEILGKTQKRVSPWWVSYPKYG